MAYKFRIGSADLSGSMTTDDIAYSEDEDTLIDFSSDRIKLKTNNTSRLEVGNNRISIKDQLVVGSVDVGTWALTPPSEDILHVQDGNAILQANSADSSASELIFNKSRNASDGSITIVQDDDKVGAITFMAADGSGYEVAAGIAAYVDGTPGSNDMPGRLAFFTTADGANSPTERMRVDSSGKVGIGTGTPLTTFHAYADISNAYVATIDNDAGSSAHGLKVTTDGTGTGTNILDLEAASTTVFKVRGDGRVGIGVDTPGSTLSVDDEIAVGEKLIHRGDPDTYLQFPSNNNITFAAGGSEELKVASDAVLVKQYIRHIDDLNTQINFTDDRIQFEAGGITLLGCHQKSSAPHQVTVNNGGNNVDFYVKDDDNETVLMTDASTTRVGIGTDSPVSTLHIEHVDTTTWPLGGTSNETYSDFLLTLRNNTDTIDAFAGIAFDISTETDSDSIGAAIVAQCADATSTQHDTDLVFATNQISDDDLSERMRITHDGRIGFGTPDPELGIDATYAMYASQGDSYCLKLHNDGDSNNRRGLYIACGSDDSLGTNYAIAFADGDDTWQGSIKFTGGTTSYMAFTAAHPAEIPEGHSYDYGTIVCVTSTTSNNRSIVYNVTKSTSAEQASVLGCYSDDNGGVEGPPARHSVCAVGDGHILVCSEGGNIAIGDYICSSNTAGHGMKQSSGALMNYTVAKAFQAVDWSTESSTTKLIACTYHCG